jgi:hypothetical protein
MWKMSLHDRTHPWLQPHVVSCRATGPDLPGEDANFVLVGAHAATSFAIDAARLAASA